MLTDLRQIYAEARKTCPIMGLFQPEERRAYLDGVVDALRTGLTWRNTYNPEAYGDTLRAAYTSGFSCR